MTVDFFFFMIRLLIYIKKQKPHQDGINRPTFPNVIPVKADKCSPVGFIYIESGENAHAWQVCLKTESNMKQFVTVS